MQKKSARKKSEKQGIVPETLSRLFSLRRESQKRFQSSASTKRVKAENPRNRNRKTAKGWKREHCAGLCSCALSQEERLNPGTQPFIYLAPSTRRVRARFPHFDGFHPKFSAGTSPFLLSLADLHNILEILYKISLLSFSLFLFLFFPLLSSA